MKTQTSLALALSLAIAAGCAPLGHAAPATTPLQTAPEEAPEPRIKPTRRVIYKTTTDAAGQPVELRMNIFEPPGHTATDKTPVIVFFFGGGWNSGNPNVLSPHAAYFASRGIVAVAPDYRVRNRQQTTPFESVADGKSAIRYVRAHANELGIDPDRIIASGTSAGGHVAACTAIVPGQEEKGEDTTVSSVPNALALYNPVIDTSPAGYGNGRLKERWQEISPLQHVRPGLAPTIVFHGDADKTVPYANAVAFDAAMKKAGNRCELVTLPGVGHGFVPPFSTPVAQRAVRETDVFLASLGYLKGAPTIPAASATN
jgi:acetyl esterase